MIGDNIDILKKVEDAVHLNNVSTLYCLKSQGSFETI